MLYSLQASYGLVVFHIDLRRVAVAVALPPTYTPQHTNRSEDLFFPLR